jgi:hypothetical protein
MAKISRHFGKLLIYNRPKETKQTSRGAQKLKGCGNALRDRTEDTVSMKQKPDVMRRNSNEIMRARGKNRK